MNPDPSSGAGSAVFATTHWSVVLAASQQDTAQSNAALERLCRTYWYPLYAYVRRRGRSPHDAQDLTQEFFARLLARNDLRSVGPEKGRFRSFLLAAMNHFLADQRDWAKAAKRGGGNALISLDEEQAERRYQGDLSSPLSPDTIFERRWATTLLEQAFEKLRQEFVASGKVERFERLKIFLEDGTGSGDYEQLGKELGMGANAIAAAVHRLRQRYRELVRTEVAHTVARPNEVNQEMQFLLAVLAK